MGRGKIMDALKGGKVLISDGAWGTFMHKKGLGPGECPELWCVERPNDIYDIAKSYVDAGSDMIEANSFGGSSFKLRHYGLAGRVSEINEAAAALSKKAAGDNAWVIASIGPTGEMLVTEEVTEEELYDSFKEQAIALERGGADAACIETMSAIDEACLAIKAVKENTKMEIICTYSFELTPQGVYRTMMGVDPTSAVKASVEAGAHIVGTNCGNGLERMIIIVDEMRKSNKTVPILVHANAGLPIVVNGKDTFPDTPEFMAELTPKIVAVGANIVGGCCGSTPAHITAMKASVNK